MHRLLLIPAVYLCIIAQVVIAQGVVAQEQQELNEQQAARRAAMIRLAGTLKLEYPGAEGRKLPELLKSPVLRTNDPTRDEVDGALWLWLDGERPVSALGMTYYASGKWNYECVSLIDEALQLTGRPGWSWQPKAAPRVWTALDDAVPEAARARQAALRALPRKFDVSEIRRGERFPLRLIVQPIHTYAAPDEGLTDGALFAVSNGTNPEVLIQVEARLADGKRRWHVAFARLTAAEATVKLGDKELWKVPAVNAGEYEPREPYFAQNERDLPAAP
jgi:hypothetical protein